MKERYDETIWQKIIDYKAVGMNRKEIAEACGISSRYVTGFINVIAALRLKDFEYCMQLKEAYGFSLEVFQWCASKFNIEIPADAFKKPKPVKEEVKTDLKPETNIKDYTLYFQKMLELQAQTNELLNQMMDVVVPKYVAEIKDNQNVNFDVISQSMKRQEDKLEAIKIGIRRKGAENANNKNY